MQDKNSKFVFTSRMTMLLRFLFRILFRVRVTGSTHEFRGSRLVVANCDSALDGVLLGLFLPGSPLVAVTPEMRKSLLVRLLLRAVPHCMPDAARPYAIKDIVHAVRAGRSVVIFPQGRVTTTGGLMKIHDSAGVVAAHCGVPVTPVRIEGTLGSRFAAVSQRWPRRWFPRVSLTVGNPIALDLATQGSGRQRRAHNATRVLRVMQRLMSEYRPGATLFDAYVNAVEQYGRFTQAMEDARQQPESYGSLLRTALALGRLTARVTRPGETVGMLMPNISASVALLLGLAANRRVTAILNYSSGAENMRASCRAAKVGTVITSRAFVQAAKLGEAIKALMEQRIIYIEDLRASLGVLDKLWLIAFAVWFPRLATRDADPADPAVVLFTSGSEGRPKGVVLSHAGMLAGMSQLRAVIDFGPDDRYFNALPLYHVYGLVACTLMPLMTGTPLFLYISPLRYRSIPELVYQKQCTYVFGTSTFLGHYARHAHPYDFRSVRVVVSGGEKLNHDVVELWHRKFGLRIYEGYGATECGPAMTLNTPLEYRAETVGRFLPGVEYRLVPVLGVASGGVLHVRSPNLMLGYYFESAPGVLVPPRADALDGWHETGDVVEVDAEGFVSIRGRVRRFVKIAGEMVSLDMVERIAIHASPDHAHAASLAQLPGSGEISVLFTTDTALDRGALRGAARELGAHEIAVARRVVHVSKLPLLGNGKTDYVALRLQAEKHLEQAETAP